MLLVRSPTLTFALIFSIFSICLSIITFNIQYDDSKNLIQLLIICPPLNSLFIFLFSLTWIERRFRLSYIPFICLIILLGSSILLTTISSLYLSISIIIYFNLIYYGFFSILFLILIIVTIISYSYGSLCIHRYRNMMTNEQQTNQNLKDVPPMKLDKLILNSSNSNELILFMSILPGRRIRHDIRNIQNDLNQLEVETILTLNEPKELSFMNMTNKNNWDMDTYSTHIKRANMEHIIYSIRDRFIPKSVGDYIQFIFSIIINAHHLNRNHILVHCMGGMGRTGMTVVCLELVYEYIMNHTSEEKKQQKFMERFCHYPFLLTNSCRVCRAISNVRKVRPGTIHNPLQIMFAHEFYGRLKSSSYMEHIKNILRLNENFLLNNQEDLHSTNNQSL